MESILLMDYCRHYVFVLGHSTGQSITGFEMVSDYLSIFFCCTKGLFDFWGDFGGFLHGDFFLQVTGASMGAKFSSSLANIYGALWEHLFLYSSSNPFCYVSYLVWPLHWWPPYNLAVRYSGHTRFFTLHQWQSFGSSFFIRIWS